MEGNIIDTDELTSWIDNDAGLYIESESIMNDLDEQVADGSYDSDAAADAFADLVDAAVESYMSTIPGSCAEHDAKQNAMIEYRDRFEDERGI